LYIIKDSNRALPQTKQLSSSQSFIIYNPCSLFLTLILCYLFHDYVKALENDSQVDPEYLAGVFYIVPFYFYGSLARLAIFPDSSETEQTAILDKVTAYQKQMQYWASHGPMNIQHK
jgi:hypothetical protein